MHMLRNYLGMALVATCLIALVGVADAAGAVPDDPKVPQLVQYQARLTDASGMPVNESMGVRVYIYDSATAGFSGDLSDDHLVYAENHQQINVVRGILRVTVGNGEPLGPFANATLPLKSLAEAAELHLELEIDGETVSPRQRIAFSNRAFTAAYAKSARDLVGDLKITTSSFPENLAAEKITTGTMDPLRFSLIKASKLTGTYADTSVSIIPYDIPLSKLDVSSGQTIAANLLPNVPAPKVQSGQFLPERLPASVLSPTSITVDAGEKLDGESVGVGVGDCQCMAALHSTSLGGAEGMNTAAISLNSNGGTIGCAMSFEEMGSVKIDTPECAIYPATREECVAYCADECADFCDSQPMNPQCGPLEIQSCATPCRMSCSNCFEEDNVGLPCKASYMCVCVD